MIPCDKCNAPSIVHQRYSGMHLCTRHFEEDVLRKIRESIREYRLLGHGGLIAVALSGGKDSSTLLYVLNRLFSQRPDIEIVGLTVNEGIAGYRTETLGAGERLARELEIPIIPLSFHEEFDLTIDEIAARKTAQSPCTFCGVLRKTLLNRAAREMGAMALATGHNLDDEAQTVMLNYLRGDIDRLFRLLPARPQPGMVPRIKPLRKVPEREVAVFAMTHGLFVPSKSCPHIPRSMRLETKEMINDLEDRHPGTKYSIMRGFSRIIDLRPEGSFKAHPCERCGEPSGEGICQTCQLLDLVKRGQSL